MFEGRDAGRIVAAILEPLQRLDDPLGDRARAQDSDDAAHALDPRLAESDESSPGMRTSAKDLRSSFIAIRDSRDQRRRRLSSTRRRRFTEASRISKPHLQAALAGRISKPHVAPCAKGSLCCLRRSGSSFASLRGGGPLGLQRSPAARFRHLAGTAEGECVGRYVLGHDGARGHIGAVPDRHRRHQCRVRADEGAGADVGAELAVAVVIAGDRAGPDVRAPRRRARRRYRRDGSPWRRPRSRRS